MTTCTLSSGYTLGCRDNIGGIQEVYIGVYNGDSMTMPLGASPTYSISSFGGATVSFYNFISIQRDEKLEIILK